jgi:heptosyltransferase-2
MAESIGILMPNWIGDVVMATPAIRAVKERWPCARLVGIVRPYVQDVLAGLPWFDELLPVNRLGKSPVELWKLARELRRRKVDTFLSLRRSMPAFALARLSMARYRIGYGAGIFTWMLTASVRPPKDKNGKIAWSTCELYQHVVEAAGCVVTSKRLELATTPADESAADAAWDRLRLPAASNVVVLNAGSATSPARVWPEEHYAALAKRVVKELNAAVLIHCGPKERDAAASLVTRVGLPEVKSLGEIVGLPIGLSKAILRRARLLVTSDSGPRHLAAAFQTPTVVLAGPLDPAANGNGNPYESAIWTKPECAPCNQSHCPLDHHCCMRELPVEQVLQAIKQAWRYKAASVAA